MNPVIILPEAEGDLAQAYQWYEKQVDGLGSEFLLCVDTRTSKQLKAQNQELKTATSVFCSLSSVAKINTENFMTNRLHIDSLKLTMGGSSRKTITGFLY